MRIVIDMQGAQTESRFRGIGRYTLALAKAIVQNRGEHEIILALSGLFPETIEPIRAEFDGLLSQENIRVWYAPGPVKECQPGNEWRREVAEHIREAFLASLQPDIIHVMSLFEGYVDDAVTSIGVFDTQTPVSVTLHDLIPLIHAEQYLDTNPSYKTYYMLKLKYLKRASLLLAVSESSRQEAIQYLNFPGKNMVTTYEAIDGRFRPRDVSKEDEASLQKKLSITRPFVLYVGGFDHRKNVKGLIQAYAHLPLNLRNGYQLVMAGKVPEGDKKRLLNLLQSVGLASSDIVFTGHVSDQELIALYNLCKLFVFPSLHEGFGLPVLEAMACGAPVIGSNTTSIPEVIGCEDALFDPRDLSSMASKLEQALIDDAFPEKLKHHGIQQAKRFSWNNSAKLVLNAWKTHAVKLQRSSSADIDAILHSRPKLAYISPLPPEKSGISDYSAELLPELFKYYDIEVIVSQKDVSDEWIQKNCPIRDVEWFRDHAGSYDRVLYQMGNSPFHMHMFDLLNDIPGVVVLHDFFLSSVAAYMEMHNDKPLFWTQTLYSSHGYKALEERFHAAEKLQVVWKYPCNLRVLQNAIGIIVHSEYSKRLANKWYGEGASRDWVVIPLLRVPHTNQITRVEARKALGIDSDTFVVCSFGLLDPVKLNHHLLQAFLASSLSKDVHCHLIFVGENHGGDYGKMLLETIRKSGLTDRIRITGWVDSATFRKYLACADMAVQLRTLSRGETSAAVFDCMNYGLPTIVNAHGSMAELPQNAVYMLPDEFEDSELIHALETLRKDDLLRRTLGEKARETILTRHKPAECARLYAEAIEKFHAHSKTSSHSLIKAIAAIGGHDATVQECTALASSLAKSIHPKPAIRQILLDVTATAKNDLKTGIERVTRALARTLIESPPNGYRVEPVYLSKEGDICCYRYARRYTLGLFTCPKHALSDEIVELQSGDIILGLDISGNMLVQAGHSGLLERCKELGVSLYFIVHDLLPILLPECFPPGADMYFEDWLKTVVRFMDGASCVSKSTAESLAEWMQSHCPYRSRPFKIAWNHHGADMEDSIPSQGLPDDAQDILKKFSIKPTFLMVGTIEPRKGYLQVLEAFTNLWENGLDLILVIVGKEGWKDVPETGRRTIPHILQAIRSHAELGKRLFWLEGISDEYLEKVYAASTCLIMASEGEGFGLPLIEAARHKLPIIARDIPVFREVAGGHAFYFPNDKSSDVLAKAIKEWLDLYKENRHPRSEGMPYLTWKESAQNLLDIILNDKWVYRVMPDGTVSPGVVYNHKNSRLNWVRVDEIKTNEESNYMIKKIKIGDRIYLVSSDDDYLKRMGNEFEPYMVQLFSLLIGCDDIVADIGANIGMTSLLFSSLAKKVFAFEPSPSTYQILTKNLNSNGITNVETFNIGLGQKEEILTITFAKSNRSGGYISDKIRPQTDHVTEDIHITTIDHFFVGKKNPPTFLKIDVEGFEQKVIQGARGLLQTVKPTVVMELNHFCLDVLQRVTVPDFLDFMRSVFPFFYAVDADNATIVDLHVPDLAYMVMHEHVVKHRFPNLVGGFDPIIKSKMDDLIVKSKSLETFKTPCLLQPHGNIVLLADLSQLKTGEVIKIPIRIINQSQEVWRGYGNHPVMASYHWKTLDGINHTYDGIRTELNTAELAPGETIEQKMTIRAPENKGVYQLIITLVQEGVCWFEDRGFQPTVLILKVG